MKRLHEEPLVFPIGDHEYVIPPVGIDAGWELSTHLDMTAEQLAEVTVEKDYLFKLALTAEIWEQMRADGVPLYLAFRAGMAALTHFLALAQGGTPEAAAIAAEALWESGIRPEALAAWLAANTEDASSTTSPSTGEAPSSTKKPASTSGTTTSRKRATAKASTG